ncbi:hyaluronan and proteoglycan link protein 3 [Denticeps clupeoides]|uniref:Hyaluronan and proteoglycan link protein 3 n=1 Tax=Denticeps clupeoides TaxID=299321 RepID=A0AAY4B3B2_9TELE|nr:hyaluronan and proteoglycan link protein 3 [Denticeps clupeoides]XP_028814274.1 hyaluronan and proteoglycan link protein 3 [Denticeps clupeoides]
MWICRLLVAVGLQLHLLGRCRASGRRGGAFFYQDVADGGGNGEIHFRGVRLHVESPSVLVSAVQGSSVTLPCHYRYEPELSSPRRTRVKWFWQPTDGGGPEEGVVVALGQRHRTYGDFRGRVRLRRDAPGDASLVISALTADDTGRYRCEVIDGLEDESVTVELEFRGVVFPYYSPRGRYRLNFLEAKRACEEQGAALATFEQLFAAWEDGLDWCNAGWLADGTAQYPVSTPREACGGVDLAPGLRSYGSRHRRLDRYDAFCFASALRGGVYFLQQSRPLNFTEAARACAAQGAEIAKVGQLYAAWRFLGLDRCDAGWLADGSLRYPIARPRPHCGPGRPGVRTLGHPPRHHKHAVYCYRAHW